MTFLQKYCDKDFLSVLDTETPQVATYIANKVGCGRNTVLRKMAELEAKGLVQQKQIKGGFKSWLKVPEHENTDDLFLNHVRKFADEQDSELADLVYNVIISPLETLDGDLQALRKYLKKECSKDS